MVFDADVFAREAVAPGTPGSPAVVERFGANVLGARGRARPRGARRIVFADPCGPSRPRGDRAPRGPPAVRGRVRGVPRHGPGRRVQRPAADRDGSPRAFDVLVVVAAPVETQVERLMRDAGCPRRRPRADRGAGCRSEEKAEDADVLLDNEGSARGARGPGRPSVWNELGRPRLRAETARRYPVTCATGRCSSTPARPSCTRTRRSPSCSRRSCVGRASTSTRETITNARPPRVRSVPGGRAGERALDDVARAVAPVLARRLRDLPARAGFPDATASSTSSTGSSPTSRTTRCSTTCRPCSSGCEGRRSSLGVVSNFEAWLDGCSSELGVRAVLRRPRDLRGRGDREARPGDLRAGAGARRRRARRPCTSGTTRSSTSIRPLAVGMFPVLIDRRDRFPDVPGRADRVAWPSCRRSWRPDA